LNIDKTDNIYIYMESQEAVMKRYVFSVTLIAVLILAAGTALADNINGRIGVTGRLGFIVPADSDILGPDVSTDSGFIGGGGLIYGLTKDVALEFDITHASFGSNAGIDFDTTDISFGGQYRFVDLPIRQLVPFVGGGLDILINDASNGLDVDTVAGVHVKGGADYFITRDLAATAEMKVVIAPDADINNSSGKVGNFDPTSFSMTFGVRYFFN
jgi:outer membrane protein